MTFNIRYGTARDGENHWNYRKKIVFDILNQDYDFFLLQEVLPFQRRELSDVFGSKYGVIYRTREVSSQDGEGSPIFYKNEFWKPLKTGTFWLSDTPDVPGSRTWGNSMPRIVTWGVFQNKISGSEIIVTNTHFDYESVTTQIKSAQLLLQFVKEKNLPAILGGDFNAAYTSESVNLFRQEGFQDSWQTLHPEEPTATYHGWTGSTVGDQIDFLLTQTQRFETQDTEIITKKYGGRYPSDHFPVHSFFHFSSR